MKVGNNLLLEILILMLNIPISIQGQTLTGESLINRSFSQQLLIAPKKTAPSVKPIPQPNNRTPIPIRKSISSADLPKTNSILNVKKKEKRLPVKITPQFGNIDNYNNITTDYLYNGIINSNIYLNYKSTQIDINQNSLNITVTY